MKNAILVENGFFDMSLWQTLLVCGIVVIVGILICLGISAIRKHVKKNKDNEIE
ncbi:MAG: hypothetical protein K6G13_08320 [Agathobacter sp.]|uniref:hypothetical protein n=1 Tax=Agathobacter sp. TaxID=2021311 RepID=UPI00258DB394|nr:hypothetical protein [Agathobacter sp.]MCR5678018.1 hypothetical protein [Agathobacter sp.]